MTVKSQTRPRASRTTRRAVLLGALPIAPVRVAANSASSVDRRFLDSLGRAPERPRPIGQYLPARHVGSLVFLSATPAKRETRIEYPGVLGRDLTLEAGRLSARRAMLTLLEYLWFDLEESLQPVVQFVSLTGYVASADGFWQQAEVMDGASQVLVEVFGRRVGLPTRTSVGVRHMPRNASVAVAGTVEIRTGVL